MSRLRLHVGVPACRGAKAEAVQLGIASLHPEEAGAARGNLVTSTSAHRSYHLLSLDCRKQCVDYMFNADHGQGILERVSSFQEKQWIRPPALTPRKPVVIVKCKIRVTFYSETDSFCTASCSWRKKSSAESTIYEKFDQNPFREQVNFLRLSHGTITEQLHFTVSGVTF